MPVSGALVIRVAAVGALIGGWDVHSVRVPNPGDKPWAELEHDATITVQSSYTDNLGRAAVAPFAASCAGSATPFGSRQTNGCFVVFMYKRGYRVCIVDPGVDTVVPSRVTMVRYRRVPTAWEANNNVNRILESYLHSIHFKNVAALRNHVLADGRNLERFVSDEIGANYDAERSRKPRLPNNDE